VHTDEDSESKGIPGFWLRIFKNIDIISPMIQVSSFSPYLLCCLKLLKQIKTLQKCAYTHYVNAAIKNCSIYCTRVDICSEHRIKIYMLQPHCTNRRRALNRSRGVGLHTKRLLPVTELHVRCVVIWTWRRRLIRLLKSAGCILLRLK